MSIINSKMITTGIFFLFIFLSGFWLSRSGKPYNGLAFNIHKFVGLGTGIYLIRSVYLAHKAAPLNSTEWTAIAVTNSLFLLTVAAGGLLSMLDGGNLQNMGAGMQRTIELAHKFSPYLIVVAAAVTLYLLLVPKL